MSPLAWSARMTVCARQSMRLWSGCAPMARSTGSTGATVSRYNCRGSCSQRAGWFGLKNRGRVGGFQVTEANPPMVQSSSDFLRSIAVAAAVATTAAQSRELRKIGLQLYTVRALLKSDFEGTL